MAKSTPKALIPPDMELQPQELLPALGTTIKDLTLQLIAARVQAEKFKEGMQFWANAYEELKNGSD
jgi:hypothetical protein